MLMQTPHSGLGQECTVGQVMGLTYDDEVTPAGQVEGQDQAGLPCPRHQAPAGVLLHLPVIQLHPAVDAGYQLALHTTGRLAAMCMDAGVNPFPCNGLFAASSTGMPGCT